MKKKIVIGIVILLVILSCESRLVTEVYCRITETVCPIKSQHDYQSTIFGYGEVTSFKQMNDTFRTCLVEGYAATSASGEGNRTVSFILIGNDVYEITGSLSWNSELNSNQRYKSPELQRYNRKVTAEFTPIFIKDGVYRIYYFDQENEDEYCFIPTTATIEKKGDSVQLQPQRSVTVDPVTYVETDAFFLACWDSENLIRDDSFYFYGVAFPFEKNSWMSEMYLEITFEDGTVQTYAANLEPYEWANDYFQSTLYTLPKFSAYLPIETFKNQKVNIKFIVCNDENLAGSKTCEVQFSETGYKVSY